MAQIVRLTPGQFDLPSGKKIVRADEIQTVLDARQAIAAAETTAEEIRQAAEREREEERQRGYQDGMEEAKAEMATQILAVAREVDDYYASVESVMVDLVKDAVTRVIGTLDDEQQLFHVVRKALTMVRNQAKVILHVAPSQEEFVRDQLDKLLEGLPGIGFVDVVPDGRAKVGSCILKSDMGIIEASIESQLKALEASLDQHRSDQEQEPADQG